VEKRVKQKTVIKGEGVRGQPVERLEKFTSSFRKECRAPGGKGDAPREKGGELPGGQEFLGKIRPSGIKFRRPQSRWSKVIL